MLLGRCGVDMVNLLDLSQKIEQHLEQKILPFWLNLKDQEHGGFYGGLSYDLQLEPQAVKGCILNSRILWSFANAYLFKSEPQYLEAADHAYRFMVEHCFDHTYGGIYWSMNYDGTVSDSTKHTYNQAFAIYALSSYYAATGKTEALDHAFALYEVIERKCKDERGYLESFNYKFEPEDNSKLSENGVMAVRTMNTLLHVFEAYTELYRVLKAAATNNQGELNERKLEVRALQVKHNLYYMLDLIATKIYNPHLERQEVFFDDNWNSLIDLHSYGHDIETSWLVDRCLDVLDDQYYTAKIRPIVNALAQKIYEHAYRDHSLLNECERGVDNCTRVWWVQAEAVVGFLNAYHNTQEDKFLEAAADIYHYIETTMTDLRPGSEWYWSIGPDGTPDHKPIVEPWKCPYHNSRMCYEAVRRLKAAAADQA